MRRPTLLFYCQHSLGLGHLYRSLALCEALSQQFRIVLLCGGKLPRTVTLPDGVELVALPPLGASVDGSLLSHDGRRSLASARRLRRDIILRTYREERSSSSSLSERSDLPMNSCRCSRRRVASRAAPHWLYAAFATSS